MLRMVRNTVETHCLFHPGQRVVVAVSGGPDSVALLHILLELRELQLDLTLAHLNHQLRGAEADSDETFVRSLAERYGIPLALRRTDVRALSRTRGMSLEQAGRTARYEFFRSVASEVGADRIAIGHHADDQAETFLLRLLRGSGTSGLAGMLPLNGDLARPLLFCTRADIIEYLHTRGIPYRLDCSNDDTRFQRNRIRHELLPMLTSYNPGISGQLASTATILAGDNMLLENLTREALDRCCVQESNEQIHLLIPALISEPRALRLRMYRSVIRSLQGHLLHLSAAHLTALDCLLDSTANKTLNLPGGLQARREYQQLVIIFQPLGEASKQTDEIAIPGPGSYHISDNLCLTLRISDPPDSFRQLPDTVTYINLDEAPFPWHVRYRLPGDRIKPLGMAGSQKIKQLFIDLKIPPAARRRVPLLYCGEHLLWVIGIKRSRIATINSGPCRILRLELLGSSP